VVRRIPCVPHHGKRAVGVSDPHRVVLDATVDGGGSMTEDYPA
jgi:hypothetical protein